MRCARDEMKRRGRRRQQTKSTLLLLLIKSFVPQSTALLIGTHGPVAQCTSSSVCIHCASFGVRIHPFRVHVQLLRCSLRGVCYARILWGFFFSFYIHIVENFVNPFAHLEWKLAVSDRRQQCSCQL